MISTIAMPTINEWIVEGILLKWLKKEGDEITTGDIVAEAECDKITLDLEAPGAGVLKKILVQEGSKVPMGRILAIIADKDESIDDVLASIELTGEIATDQKSMISLRQPDSVHSGSHQVPLSSMRETIARRMTFSKTNLPHYYLTMDMDIKDALAFRLSYNKQEGTRISLNDIIVKAAALALKKVPQVNSTFAGNRVVVYDHADIGVAVALDEGLVTPVVQNCDEKTLAVISEEIRELASRAKKRKLLPEEYTNATFTVSNLGSFGIDEFAAIINPPEAAILAVGASVQKPVVENGQIVIGHRMKVTLSCDHRAIDGAVGARFLREFSRILARPADYMS